MRIKIGDLWDTAFYTSSRRNLNSSWQPNYLNIVSLDDKKKIKRAGTELMGAQVFESYANGLEISQEV